MIYSGLVSVTFRKFSPMEIVEITKIANLQSIEWGGDVHVPHGNYTQAKAIRKLTETANLKIASYGSYYFAGESGNTGLPFTSVLNTAIELNAPNIRVWAGKKGSDEADNSYRKMVIEDLEHISEMAQKNNISVSLEFHTKTLTDTNESTFKLIEQVRNQELRFYWQPPIGKSVQYCIEGLNFLLPRLTNLHVYYWTGNYDAFDRHPLVEGKDIWKNYIDLTKTDGKDHFALLEFVKDDDPIQLIDDAKVLNNWLK
jgi:3-dehydroshikimate dehydratase